MTDPAVHAEWRALADHADTITALEHELARALTRITHLEQLITRYATADHAWFDIGIHATIHRAQQLHDAEHALRTEAALIHEEALPT